MKRSCTDFTVGGIGFRDPALTGMLILQTATILVAAPSAAVGFVGWGLELDLLRVLTGLLIVLIARSRLVLIAAVVAFLMIVSGNAFSIVAPSSFAVQFGHVGTIIGFIVISVVIGRAVFAPGIVTAYRVLGAIVLYLNFGMIAAAVYRVIWDFLQVRSRDCFRCDSGAGNRHPDLFQFRDADDNRLRRHFSDQCLCKGLSQSGRDYRSTISGDIARALRLAGDRGAPPVTILISFFRYCYFFANPHPLV